MHQSHQWLRHGISVLGAIQSLRSQLVQARDNYDRYRKDPAKLGDYKKSLEDSVNRINVLQQITADNPQQQQALGELEGVLRFQPESPDKLLFTERQRHLMVELGANEQSLLEHRQTVFEAQSLWIFGGVAVSVLVSLAAIAALNQEVTKRLRLQEKLKKRTAQLEAITSVIPAVVLIRDRQGTCLEILSQGENLLVQAPHQMIGKKPLDVLPIGAASMIMGAITEALDTRKTVGVEYQVKLPDGRVIWFDTTVTAIDNDTVLVVAEDATFNYQQRAQLVALAIKDALLTELYNYRGFSEIAEGEIAIQKRRWGSGESSIGLLLIDIDNFKEINTQYSHAGGNAVLKAIASILTKETRAGSTVSRLGGDEMAILLRDATQADAEVVADRIREAVEAMAIAYENRTIRVTVSVGIAMYQPSCNNLKDLLIRASEALLEGKAKGRNRVEVAS